MAMVSAAKKLLIFLLTRCGFAQQYGEEEKRQVTKGN